MTDRRPLRLAIVGNLCCNAVLYRQLLRGTSLQTELYMGRGELEDCTTDTLLQARADAGSLRDLKHHDWRIDIWDEWPAFDWLRRLPGGTTVQRALCFARFVASLRRADLVLSFAMYHIPAWMSGRPHVACCTGADLHEIALERGPRGWMMRRALRRAPVVKSSYDPLSRRNASRLGIRSIEPLFIPIPVGPRPVPPVEADGPVRVFMPSRHDWADESRDGIAKGNDRFVRAWARRVHEGWSSTLTFITYGEHVDATRRLVRDLGVEEHVEFRPKMLQEDLQREIERSDLIADQFDQGTPGALSLQAMATGRALAMYWDPASTFCYSEVPPLLNSKDEEELYDLLGRYATRDSLMDLGRSAHAWMSREYGHRRLVRSLLLSLATASGDSHLATEGDGRAL